MSCNPKQPMVEHQAKGTMVGTTENTCWKLSTLAGRRRKVPCRFWLLFRPFISRLLRKKEHKKWIVGFTGLRVSESKSSINLDWQEEWPDA